MIDAQTARAVFADRFDGPPQWIVRSPGRVNLIGEHIDYNDGLVLPMAIDRGITVAARRTGGRAVRVWAENFADYDEFDLDRLDRPGRHRWSHYVRGMAAVLRQAGVELVGGELAILTDLPVGGGLSSSAALEVGAQLALLAIAGGQTIEPLRMAQLAQQAEHQYAGVPCGLMDQFAVVFGRAGHAVRMDCRSLDYWHVPCDHEAIAWVVLDSRAPRELGSSGYAQRRKECDKSLAAIRKAGFDVASYRDVNLAMVEQADRKLGPLLARRARHVVTETARVVEGSEYLSLGRYDLFGRLMYASHQSLAEDFEVSIDALDAIVQCAADTLGVYGCRLTGGGWGGCAIALLAAEAVGVFRERITDAYVARFGREPGFLIVRPSDGASVAPA